MKQDADIYDDVDEATYQDLVKKRRADDFIEDDGALGLGLGVGLGLWFGLGLGSGSGSG